MMGGVPTSQDGDADRSSFSVGDPVLRKTRLLREKCATCIFRPGNQMRLSEGRLKNIVDEALADDSYIICHDTLPYGDHPEAKPAVCRGFFDRYSTNTLRVMARLWGFTEVEPPGGPPPQPGQHPEQQTPISAARRQLSPDASPAGPIVFVDVDGVLIPAVRSGGAGMAEAGYLEHPLDLPDIDGEPRPGWVWINPAHGRWLRDLAEEGCELVWLTSWNGLAAQHLAPLLDLPDMPVVEVPADGEPRFGWSPKLGPIKNWVGSRPFVWLDDCFGGREHGWATDRTVEVAPTLLVPVDRYTGLTDANITVVRRWLRDVDRQG